MIWELGCYGDGTFGHQHTRERCGELLHTRAIELEPSRLHDYREVIFSAGCIKEALHADMSDDGSEEHEACDWLNSYAAVDGASWGWQDGDFGLWPVEDDT